MIAVAVATVDWRWEVTSAAAGQWCARITWVRRSSGLGYASCPATSGLGYASCPATSGLAHNFCFATNGVGRFVRSMRGVRRAAGRRTNRRGNDARGLPVGERDVVSRALSAMSGN